MGEDEPRTLSSALAAQVSLVAAAALTVAVLGPLGCSFEGSYDGTSFLCAADTECPSGQSCLSGRCQVGAASGDGGVGLDAGDGDGGGDPRLLHTIGDRLTYTFDTDDAEGIVDRSGRGLDAFSANLNPTTGVYGFGFGDEGTVFVPDNDALFVGTRGTFEAWVRVSSLPGIQAIYGDAEGASDSPEYSIELDDGHLRLVIGTAEQDRVELLSSQTAVRVSEWTHIAVVLDDGDVRFYADGELIEQLAFDGAPRPRDHAYAVASFTAGEGRLLGEIDEVKVSSYAKTEAELLASRDFDTASAPPRCGDRLIEGDEQCEVGDLCCSGCQLPAEGTACGDGDVGSCTAEGVCDIDSERRTLGLFAFYPFDEGVGDVVGDQRIVVDRHDLVIGSTDNAQWDKDEVSLEITGDANLRGEVTGIVGGMENGDEFTAEFWGLSHTEQPMARIIDVAIPEVGFAPRLATLGESAHSFTFRISSTNSAVQGAPVLRSTSGDIRREGPPQHVVVTRSKSGERRLYVDGRLRGSNVVSGELGEITSSSVPMLVLANRVEGDRVWLGSFHMVALFTRALTPTDVAAHFAAGPDAENPIDPQ